LGEVRDGRANREARPLTLQRLLALASPENKKILREQLAADASVDVQAIRKWRSQQHQDGRR
jgi:hypothetical protein